MNAAKACKSAAAQNVRQDSFGLIVRSVRNSNFVQVMFARALREKRVTQTSRGGLQVGFITLGDSFYGGCRGIKRQLMLARQGGNEFFVGVRRPAAKFMIEMQDAKRNPEIFFEPDKEQQQSHRIRAPGDGQTHAMAFAN